MDRGLIEERLKMAQRHVAEGEGHIARQHAIIAELKKGGYDLTLAEGILKTLQDTQATHESDRDRLLEMLRRD